MSTPPYRGSCLAARNRARPGRIGLALFAIFTVSLAVLAPHAAVLTLAATALVAQLAVTLLQLLSSRRIPGAKRSGRTGAPPPEFISVHVATHNEPPELVIRTLAALLRQRGAPPHEIIVIDNNTADPALWRPVERFAREHPGRVRFHHVMGVTGAKAGALNIARDLTDPRATHVAVVDADYVTTEDFLATAAARLRSDAVDFVQFPQAYAAEDLAAGPAQDLVDYFLRHARLADGARAMLLTGTLSVISLRALDTAGGWRHDSSTEDAELGVRLQLAGFEGSFVDARVGEGLLPLSVRSLSHQRARWAAGNFRTLLLHAPVAGLGLGRSLAIVAQLTAWLNFSVPAWIGILWGLWASWAGAPLSTAILAVSTLTLALALFSAVIPMASNALWHGRPPGQVARAVLSRLAVLPGAGLATVGALIPRRQAFAVTPKTWRRSLRPGADAAFAALAAAAVTLATATGHPVVAIFTAVAFAASCLASFATARTLRTYRLALEGPDK